MFAKGILKTDSLFLNDWAASGPPWTKRPAPSHNYNKILTIKNTCKHPRRPTKRLLKSHNYNQKLKWTTSIKYSVRNIRLQSQIKSKCVAVVAVHGAEQAFPTETEQTILTFACAAVQSWTSERLPPTSSHQPPAPQPRPMRDEQRVSIHGRSEERFWSVALRNTGFYTETCHTFDIWSPRQSLVFVLYRHCKVLGTWACSWAMEKSSGWNLYIPSSFAAWPPSKTFWTS